jgi:starch synthase
MFVASECVPFAKTGGLGDVVGALPPALAARGHDVRVVMPRYGVSKAFPAERLPAPLGVHTGYGERWCGVYRSELPNGVPVYLLEHDELYGRTGIYGDARGDFGDNALRFALLSRAALVLRFQLGFDPDVFHVHDWQAALVPAYLSAAGERKASVLTLHNLGYQGIFGLEASRACGLDVRHAQALGLEHFGALNLLKGGIVNATNLSTVSPRYSIEIQTPEGGAGLDGELRLRSDALVGILNGIDDSVWNPATDPLIPAHFSADDLSGKAACKAALQREMGLPERPSVPIIGMVSRFAHQKGIDIFAGALEQLLHLDLQFAILGSGEAWAEGVFRRLNASTWSVRARFGYDERLAHLIEAGSDFFAMPSRYEPCGLNQMYSQRYGTPPIVRAVGGLMDTVEHDHTGFVFEELSPTGLARAITHAAAVLHHRPHHYRAIQASGMRKRMGWDQAAAQYEALYRLAMRRAGVT